MKTAFTIEFRAKVHTNHYSDGSAAARFIRVPKLGVRHVADMGAARASRKFGMYANSDLFPSMISRAAESVGCRRVGDYLCVDLLANVPPEIVVDESGFLANVRISVPDVA